MLLNILQCTGWLPTTKNYLAPNINSAKVEKPCCDFVKGHYELLDTIYHYHHERKTCLCAFEQAASTDQRFFPCCFTSVYDKNLDI